MKSYELGISIARISGLEKDFYFFDEKRYYAWKIKFSKVSTIWIGNLPFIYLGKTEKEAKKTIAKYKNNFSEAKITENDMVAVMFDINDMNEIIAIESLGHKKWVDVRDGFKVKSFKELELEIKTLRVY